MQLSGKRVDGGDMPRLFTGLEVPGSLRSLLSLKQSGLPGVKWVEPADFHITLRFIGDVSNRIANEIVDVLSDREWPAPTVRPGEIKAFGGAKPTAIYVSVLQDERLFNLASTQERMMQELGLAAETRRYTPHITLGRCRDVAVGQMAAFLADKGAGIPGQDYRPARFVLYSARQSRGGGPYRVEQAWQFLPPKG